MSVPVGSAFTGQNTNPKNAAGHQLIRSVAPYSGAAGGILPVPVASTLKGGTLSVAFSESITAQGGTSPYTFAVTSGSLPSGLSLSSSGLISGTPTLAAMYTFTITVTDASSYTGTQSFSITIAATVSSSANYGFVS